MKRERELLAALMKLKKKRDNTRGICQALEGLIEADNIMLYFLFETWPRFTGNVVYPIPVSGKESWEAYHRYKSTCHMWDRDHPYGQARWELLEHCINKLKESINGV